MARKRSRVSPAPEPAAARAPQRWRWAALALLLLAALTTAWLLLRPPAPPAPAHAGPAAAANKAAAAQHVPNAQCVGCHAPEAAAWRESHHAKAMAPASETSVRGDFADATFSHQGRTTRFFRRDERYFVNTEGADGKPADFEVRYTFGHHPLQQYLIETEAGRLQPLGIAWDANKRAWFHLLPNERLPAGDVLHWTGRYQTGNTMCIGCHTTAFDKRYDEKADRFDSRWAEVNVSCQACHGPGSIHAQWAQQRGPGKPAYGAAGAHAGAQVQLCAACHSRRAELTAVPVPGEPQLDHYLPSLLREGLYHADGQQLDEVFVDGSFRQSKMFMKGVRCTDCHDPHSAKPKLEGNALCLQCHGSAPNARFPAAAGAYDSPSHDHHAAGSPGAQCTACHMPAKAYMRIQARPDHSMRIPRPDLSLTLGTPNACNQCHTDRSPKWAADAIERWVGPKARAPHYGEAFAAARAGQPGADRALAALARDAALPPIVRATALDQLRGLGHNDAHQDALQDADAEVRATAAAGLDALPASQRVPALAPLLRDTLRAVRISAARSLASLPADQFDTRVRADFDAALAEYIAAQRVALDMPGPNLNLGALYEDLKRDALAEQHYQAALRIDPDFTAARANLSRFYAARTRLGDAETVLRDGLQRQPGIGELQYSLGLLLAEQQRLPEATQALAQAAKRMPQRARVHYNLGLAYQQTGQPKRAEAALLDAQRLDPNDAAMPYALAVLYAQNGQRAQALAAAERVRALRPGDVQAERMVQQLSAPTR